MDFAGTASFYSRFRPSYPASFYQRIGDEFPLDGTGTLLDLGAGPGTLFAPLANGFEQVVALDPEPEMIEEGRRLMQELGIANVIWRLGAAEEFEFEHPVRLITAGNSFLWMDRPRVVERGFHMLASGGGMVMIQRRTFWEGEEPWRVAILEVIRRWLGPERQTARGVFRRPLGGHVHSFHRCPFRSIDETQFVDTVRWTEESMLGFLFSNSFCSPALLGDCRKRFESDFRSAWRQHAMGGPLIETIHYDAILARK